MLFGAYISGSKLWIRLVDIVMPSKSETCFIIYVRLYTRDVSQLKSRLTPQFCLSGKEKQLSICFIWFWYDQRCVRQ